MGYSFIVAVSNAKKCTRSYYTVTSSGLTLHLQATITQQSLAKKKKKSHYKIDHQI